MLVGAAGSLLAAGTVAAATGLWSGPPALVAAQREVAALERVFGQAHQDTAIELARSGDHVLYGARTAGGGYCLSVGTGGGVGQCTVPAASPDLEDPTWFGTEGRLGVPPRRRRSPPTGMPTAAAACSAGPPPPTPRPVAIGLPGDAPAAVATVGPNGFFVVGLPEAGMAGPTRRSRDRARHGPRRRRRRHRRLRQRRQGHPRRRLGSERKGAR